MAESSPEEIADAAHSAAGASMTGPSTETRLALSVEQARNVLRAAADALDLLVAAGETEEAGRQADAVLLACPPLLPFLLRAAETAVANGAADRAVTILEAAIPLAPQRLKTYSTLAKLLQKLGRLDESDAALAHILRHEPDNRSAADVLARNAALRRRRLTGRREASGEEVATADGPVAPVPNPSAESAALQVEAAGARQAGDPAAAVALLRKALVLRPDRIALWRDLVACLRSVGAFDEEAEALQRMLAVNPARAATHQALADNARRRGDPSSVARHLTAAVALTPGDAALRRRLVEALRGAGDADGLRDATDAMVRDFPDDLDGLLLAASVAEARDDTEAQAALLDRAVALSPAGDAAIKLANALHRSHRRGVAETVLLHAAEAEPNATVLVALGKLAVDAGDPQKAIVAFERAVALDPSEAAGWTALVGLSTKWISAGRARTVLSQARAVLGDHPALDAAEFDHLRQTGQHAQAERLLTAAIARSPENASLRSRQRALDFDFGRYEAVEAASAAQQPKKLKDKVAAALLAGRVEEGRWRLPAALEAFERGVALDAGTSNVHEAAARVLIGLLRPLEARRHLALSKKLSHVSELSRGRSLNPSQSLLGQLMTECWSNQAAMQLGQAAIAADRLDAFLTLVTEEPDYTPGAIAFMVFLRRHGLFDIRPPLDGADAIPRRIVQFWDTDPPPTDVVELMESWRFHNPGWQHVHHTDRTARDTLDRLADPRLRRAYRVARKPAQKADLLRLALLFHEGGVYADADDRCEAPLDDLVAGRSFVVAQEERGSIGNNFIAAVPGHPLVGAALELAIVAMLRGDADTIWLSTGPGLLTRALATHLAASETNRSELGRSLVVMRRPDLRRFCVPHCHIAYKSTVRHWSKHEFGQAV